MVADGANATRTQRVFEQLRTDILSGVYMPGAPLRMADLSAKLGVSLAVVREALVRLSELHLVSLAPNQGFSVCEVSREDLADLVGMRILLEGEALRRSIQNGDLDWETQVVAAHYTLERTPIVRVDGVGTSDAWTAAHAHFHQTLEAACDSPRLIAFTSVLRDSAELYRQLSESGGIATGRDVAAEHRELMELATTRQAEAAVAALVAHIRRTAETVAAFEFEEQLSAS